MCLSAAIPSPLRSNRAMISPVSRRAKASGLIRMSVLSMAGSSDGVGRALAGGWADGAARRSSALDGPAARRSAGGRRRPRATARRAGARASARPALSACYLGLAERAYLPAGIERLAAAPTGLPQAPQAARTAQEVLLDVKVAVGAYLTLELSEACLGGLDLDLSLVDVLEVLGRAHDHVDDRADEREDERRDGGRAHEHRVGDPAARIRVRVEGERQPERGEEQQQQADYQAERVVLDAEDGDRRHGPRSLPGRGGRTARRCHGARGKHRRHV